MKTLILGFFIVLAGCSSRNSEKTVAPEDVTNESFKKAKQLSTREVPDFYPGSIKAENPALQDETLDRYTGTEISGIAAGNDPLLAITIKCSNKEFEAAYSMASKVFNEYQKIPAYWNMIANCHLNQGSQRKALLFYNKALELDSNYIPALNNIGVMYSRLGQNQKALLAFERANKKSRFSKTPRYNLAKLYLGSGLAELALPLFLGLHSSSPADVDILNALGTCYFFVSDYQRAWAYFQKIPKNYWSQAEIGLNIAMTLKHLAQTDDAIKVYESIDKPNRSELQSYYTVVKKQLGAVK